jgi:DNA-binding NarL/FixJ family response regulator
LPVSKQRVHIAVIEHSDLIFEGLFTLLQKHDQHFYLYRVQEVEELAPLGERVGLHLIITDTLVFQNRTNVLQRLRKSLPDIAWIGMVSTLTDQDILSRLDDSFTIVESTESIIGKINRCLRSGSERIDDAREQLSDRETDVLIHLAKGRSSKEIADLLNISIHTVNSHRKNITEKTGIKSLPGLTIYAITRNLIPVDHTRPDPQK